MSRRCGDVIARSSATGAPPDHEGEENIRWTAASSPLLVRAVLEKARLFKLGVETCAVTVVETTVADEVVSLSPVPTQGTSRTTVTININVEDWDPKHAFYQCFV